MDVAGGHEWVGTSDLDGGGTGTTATDAELEEAALEALAAPSSPPPGSDREFNKQDGSVGSVQGDVGGRSGAADGGDGGQPGSSRGSRARSGSPPVDVSAQLPDSLAAIVKSASWQGMSENAGSGNFLAGLPTRPITDAMKRRFLSETGLPSIDSLSCARSQSIVHNVRAIERRIGKATGRSRDWRELCPPEI